MAINNTWYGRINKVYTEMDGTTSKDNQISKNSDYMIQMLVLSFISCFFFANSLSRERSSQYAYPPSLSSLSHSQPLEDNRNDSVQRDWQFFLNRIYWPYLARYDRLYSIKWYTAIFHLKMDSLNGHSYTVVQRLPDFRTTVSLIYSHIRKNFATLDLQTYSRMQWFLNLWPYT